MKTETLFVKDSAETSAWLTTSLFTWPLEITLSGLLMMWSFAKNSNHLFHRCIKMSIFSLISHLKSLFARIMLEFLFGTQI